MKRTIQRPFVAVAAMVAAALACSSSSPTDPPKVCTLIGCEDGLRLDLEPASGWPEGDYRFSIEADETHVTCRASLPLPGCGATPSVVCDPVGVVTIVESACTRPSDTQGFPQIVFDQRLRPRTVRLSIARIQGGEEWVIATAELSIHFQASQPNGPDCPPTCTQARSTVAVRF
jgi:hypothetical protein